MSGVCSVDARLSALGPRGLSGNNSTTIGGAQAVDVTSRTHMAAKKLRRTGVLSEPRAYDAGIVALCRDLVGG